MSHTNENTATADTLPIVDMNVTMPSTRQKSPLKYRTLPPMLTFYLARRFFWNLLATISILMTFVGLMDFMETARIVSSNPSLPEGLAFTLTSLKLPDLALQVAPLAILIGTLVSFAKLTRDGELVAIRTSGMPARTFILPPMIVVLCIGMFNLLVLNPFAATMNTKYENMQKNYFPSSASGLITEGGSVWIRQEEGDKELLVYAASVQDDGRRLENATIFVTEKASGKFVRRIDTTDMRLRQGKWLLDVPIIITPKQPNKKVATMEFSTQLTPEMIQSSFTSPKTLSVFELYDFITLLKKTGFPTAEHEMQFQKLLAIPALALAMFLMAAPFALQFSRHQGMGRLILVGVLFGMLFYMLTEFITTYGIAGRIDIRLAAWLPTLIAALIGSSLFLHFREE